MALLTQRAILSTFEEMLEEMPFDKVACFRTCPFMSVISIALVSILR